MYLALNELKTKAKLLLKKTRTSAAGLQLSKNNFVEAKELQLKHCLTFVSRQLGFENWQQAQSLLSGPLQNEPALNFGTMWHNTRCIALSNHWFSHYQEAKLFLDENSHLYLMPFKNQCVVVEHEYLLMLNFGESELQLLSRMNNDLVAGYGQTDWDMLAKHRIHNQVKVEDLI